ncbi:MAG: hypothetical protein Q8K75_01700 [Chlamydiales bacterium]|nr:hypothetical protein [Chlamydiales bacterium]
MEIYSSDFSVSVMAYDSKRLLDDSVARTLKGYQSITDGAWFAGCGNILLGRVESVAAFALVGGNSLVFLFGSLVLTPCVLASTMVVTLASYLPGTSEVVKKSHLYMSQLLKRAIMVQIIAIPVIFLFLSASAVNIFLPGLLKPQNMLFSSIHSRVASLGPLLTIRVVVPGKTEVLGTKAKLSVLSEAEEFLRALSCQNYVTEVKVSRLIHHHSVMQLR